MSKRKEYDLDGNLIYEKDADCEVCYDSRGNLTHKKYTNGFTEWYDPNGNPINKIIHKKHSNGFEEWFEYDSNGNIIHKENSNGFGELFEYDANDNCIHYKNSYGYEVWYGSNGNILRQNYSF